MKRRQSIFEDVADISSFFPAWLSLFFAVLAYLLLHHLAEVTPEKASNGLELFDVATRQFFKTLAYYFQFLVPAVLSFGALICIISTHIKYGFKKAVKDLSIAIAISCAALLLLLNWKTILPPEVTRSAIFQKAIEFIPGAKTKDHPMPEKDVASLGGKPDNDKQVKIVFEVELASGRTMFANTVTAKGDVLTLETDSGVVISLQKNDVKKVQKITLK